MTEQGIIAVIKKGLTMTQKELIREHLKIEPITPLQALKLYGCFRLASVINRLRNEGHDIIMNIREDYNVPLYDRPKKYSEYHIRRIKNNG